MFYLFKERAEQSLAVLGYGMKTRSLQIETLILTFNTEEYMYGFSNNLIHSNVQVGKLAIPQRQWTLNVSQNENWKTKILPLNYHIHIRIQRGIDKKYSLLSFKHPIHYLLEPVLISLFVWDIVTPKFPTEYFKESLSINLTIIFMYVKMRKKHQYSVSDFLVPIWVNKAFDMINKKKIVQYYPKVLNKAKIELSHYFCCCQLLN